jgi:hypothetical protein
MTITLIGGWYTIIEQQFALSSNLRIMWKSASGRGAWDEIRGSSSSVGLRKQRIGARKHGPAHNRSYLTSPPQGDTIAVLQWVIQNGPLVAWAIAALSAGFTVLTGKV